MADDPPDTDRERGDEKAGPYDPAYAHGHDEPTHEHLQRLRHTLHDLRSTPMPGFEAATVEQILVMEKLALDAVHAHVAFIPEHAVLAHVTRAYRQAADRGTKPATGITAQKTASDR